MKINNFFEKTPPEPTNRRKITASGVQNVIDSCTTGEQLDVAKRKELKDGVGSGK